MSWNDKQAKNANNSPEATKDLFLNSGANFATPLCKDDILSSFICILSSYLLVCLSIVKLQERERDSRGMFNENKFYWNWVESIYSAV